MESKQEKLPDYEANNRLPTEYPWRMAVRVYLNRAKLVLLPVFISISFPILIVVLALLLTPISGWLNDTFPLSEHVPVTSNAEIYLSVFVLLNLILLLTVFIARKRPRVTEQTDQTKHDKDITQSLFGFITGATVALLMWLLWNWYIQH